MIDLNSYLDSNKSNLKFYSPYNFNKNILEANYLEQHFIGIRDQFVNNDYKVVTVKNEEYIFFYKKLQWDTDYFQIPTYRLYYILGIQNNYLKEAVAIFTADLLPAGSYCFIEIPSEDIGLIQALGENSFKLIETRLTYYNNNLQSHNHQRYSVRNANQNDIPNLKSVASKMRNDFDRFHADKVFDVKLADAFLSTYIENSILGYADYVMIPNEKSIPSDSFLTAKYLKDEWDQLNCKISKMVLSAVSSETNKGWYIKLISEMTYHLRDEVGAECIFMNTQSTNRAVFNTWEKLGYKLGCTTHVLSITK
jgi:dTDP-4-amino-4,6-dideoxy-D-galactose acyltransferase